MVLPSPGSRTSSWLVAAVFLCLAMPSRAATGEASSPGVDDARIVLGQSAAFNGAAAALGTGMRLGLLAAFGEVNRQGGVAGRRIELVSLDDGYEPEAAVANTRRLIEEHHVFALIGAVGTPTARVSQPIAAAADVPFIAPFTGAAFLRSAEKSQVVNLRGSYDQETEAWVAHLTDDLGIERIAILYQADAFGRAGLSGVRKAMQRRGLALVAEGTYVRNTTAVRQALLDLRGASPQAIVMVGAYRPIATFVRHARMIDLDSRFVTISFVGTEALAAELGADAEGVIVTQVVPHPHDERLPVVREYRHALQQIDATVEPGLVSLEGYLAGRLMIAALDAAGRDLDREGLLRAIATQRTFDIGGIRLRYGPGDNQGMNRVFLSVLSADGSYRYVDRLETFETTDVAREP